MTDKTVKKNKTLNESKNSKTTRDRGVAFRVEAGITARSPHRSVREEFHSHGSSVYFRR